MLGRLKKMIGLRRAAQPAPSAAKPDQFTVRRWESAETNRLNRAHWQNAGLGDMSTINADLYEQLPMLRARCTYEAYNNPLVEGAIETHMTDVAGPDGPTMQVQSSSEAYNKAREQVWQEWFAMPDFNGVLSGVDLIRLWVRMLWTCGEFLDQIVTDYSASGPVKMRILDLHPTRLESPLGMTTDPDVMLGVRRSREGRPKQYYISEPQPFGAYLVNASHNPISPDFILHRFKIFEAGQVRGFPWLSSSLQSVGDLRDYDSQVMDAARAAADKETLLYSDHPDAPFFSANETTTIQRRQTTTLPPGWKPWQGAASQPAAVYIDFRKERQREIGRPANMPLMKIRLGSEDHNFSSARFDGKVYERSLMVLQSWLVRGGLGRLEAEVAREAELSGAIPPRPKGQVIAGFTWAKPPHVDPEKEMAAYQVAMEIGAMDYSDVAAAIGTDVQTLIAKRQRTMAMLETAHLPPMPYWTPRGGAQKTQVQGVDPNTGETTEFEITSDAPADDAEQTADSGNSDGKLPAQGGLKTDLTLNGIQVTAALAVLNAVSAGEIAELAAIELLVGLGIPRDRAQSMIAEQSKIEPPEPEPGPAPARESKREPELAGAEK